MGTRRQRVGTTGSGGPRAGAVRGDIEQTQFAGEAQACQIWVAAESVDGAVSLEGLR